MEYKEALEYIESIGHFGSKPGLERVSVLLEALGNPQNDLKFIHIAGTNGKGSCAAMTASIIKAAGYKVGLFTSPYLYRFNERMQFNGKEIDDIELAKLIEIIKPLADKMDDNPTEFEIITAAAMLWYKLKGCDIVVLEVGLGGIYDATNIISAPEVAVIMNIGYDHTEILGDTLSEIAMNKAGIIKHGCECVLYPQTSEVTEVIRDKCDEVGAVLHIADFDEIKPEFDSVYGQSFMFKDEVYALPLLGDHQLRNAAVVLEVVEVLRKRGWSLEHSDVEHGLYAVNWPGRFELVSDEPAFIVDGGHNPQCAQAVAENLNRYFPDNRKIILLGILRDKAYKKVIQILDRVADEYVCISPDSPRALSAQELGAELEKLGKPVSVCSSIRDGVSKALELADEFDVVCAVGSLYSVGEIRACFEKN